MGMPGEYMLVDDNNSHYGQGVKYAVFRKSGDMWIVEQVDEDFKSKDKLLQKLVDEYIKHPGKRRTMSKM
jgi:hypothetical protein